MAVKQEFWVEKGVAYARSSGLQAILGVGREMISRYAKQGMPFELSGKARIYNLQSILKWKVNQESKKIFDSIQETEDELSEDFTKMPIEQLNRAMKVYGTKKLKHESKIKEIEEKAEMGLYIPAGKMDRNMAELSSAFIAILKELRQVLPTKIENMDSQSIEETLDTHFEKLLQKMLKAAENV